MATASSPSPSRFFPFFHFPFSFLLSSHFSFSSSTNCFCSFISFFLLFLFLFSSHFPIFSSSHFSSFFSLLFFFSPLDEHTVKRRKFPSPFLKPNVWLSIFLLFSFIPYSSFMTSYPTRLNMSHGIMPPMWLNVSHSFFMPSVTLLRCHVASPNLSMYHPTPHISKNVKSRPPQNPT